jgi:Tfp pilus assembly protein PilF
MLAPPPDQTPPQAVFVHQPWIGRLRLFLRGRDDPRFAGVIPAAWRFLDSLVGRLADLAGRDTLILVVSPGADGEPGVLLAAGPGVTPDPELLAARLLDVAPTVLARFGLTDPALPGRRLGAIASEPGRQTLAPAPPEPPARREPGLVYALRRHGYRPPPRPGRGWRSRGLAELAQMTLERDPRRAGAIAVASLGEDPSNLLALRIRARAHVALDEAEALPALADALTGAAPDRGWGPLARGAAHVLKGERRLAEPWLRQAESDPEAGTLLTVAAVWLAAARPANAERVFRRVAEQDPANVSALIGVAMALAARRNFLEAEATLARALARDPTRPAIYLQLADTYARTGRKAEAARAAEAAVRLGAPAPMAVAARSGRLGR